MSVDDLAERRFVFVTGKGGVGKTTVSAAMALSMAAKGKRVLVAMCGAHERMSSILGTPPIAHPVQKIAKNVWATKIDPAVARVEYGELVLKVKSVAKAVFDNKYTDSFLRAVPGMTEWALLGKAWWHTTEELPDGRPKYDIVLFDAPSTGHGLELLRVPKVITEIVPPGILRRDAEKAWAMFQDPARGGAVVVTLPEQMPTTETLELTRALRSELNIPIHRIVINGAHEPLFSTEERAALVKDEVLLDVTTRREDPGEAALCVAARRAAREQLQASCMALLREELSDLQFTVLPFLLDGAGTPEGARELSALL